MVITEEFVDIIKEKAMNPEIAEFDEIFNRDFDTSVK